MSERLIFNNIFLTKANQNSFEVRSGEYTRIKLTSILKNFNIFLVSLLLCGWQLSIVNILSSELSIWCSSIQILILSTKWQNSVESIGLVVEYKY